MERTYRVGTRTSPLALKQVEEAMVMLRMFYPGMRSEVIGIDTYGDKDKVTPISEIEETDFFTREIDEALLKNEIDFAVHSAKDLPDELRKGLTIAAITDSIDPFDALVSKSSLTLDKLPEGARIGTSSLRRKTQLKEYRNDFEIVDVRGNIEERLKLLDSNHLSYVGNRHACSLHLDAIVIAACGLIRLDLSHRITQKIPLDILKPHPLQGGLAIVAKENNTELLRLLSIIDSRKEVLS
ncbi:MAG: hydroxymethylbilane synthase [Candidatus Omnitrophota bacterium]|nr:hydroxymethylbilane synthase [Candidatus Omnitrophota bacterium]